MEDQENGGEEGRKGRKEKRSQLIKNPGQDE